METKKKCKACLEEKELCEFYNSSKYADGYSNNCKSCKVKGVQELLEEGYKRCSICSVIKEESCFYNSKRSKDGLTASCKSCKKDYTESRKYIDKYLHPNNIKTCTNCQIEKHTLEFYNSSFTFDGLNCRCMSCVDQYYQNNKDKSKNSSKQWRIDNLEKSKETAKKWQSENRDYIAEKNKIYREKNRETLNEKRKKWLKNKMESDSLFKLKEIVRKRIKNTFKQNIDGVFSKSVLTEDILGCAFEDFKIHIESQFLNWMSWENYGNVCGTELEYSCSWDLDHIIPISYAKTEEEIYMLNHWSNFQPLCSKVNRDIKKATVYPCTNLELIITFLNNE